MQLPERGVEALANDIVVANQHRTDQRVRADLPPSALRKLECPAKKRCVLFGADRGHGCLLLRWAPTD
jgi:hypothetical protein